MNIQNNNIHLHCLNRFCDIIHQWLGEQLSIIRDQIHCQHLRLHSTDKERLGHDTGILHDPRSSDSGCARLQLLARGGHVLRHFQVGSPVGQHVIQHQVVVKPVLGFNAFRVGQSQ